MIRKIALPVLLQLLILPGFAQVKLQTLLTENAVNPIGIASTAPRFSWQLTADKRGIMQTAYELVVTDGKTPVWNTGKVNSDRSVQLAYAGSALESNKKYNWKVRVWDKAGKVSAWSAPAYFHTALLHAGDWKAKWIEPGFREDSINRPAVLFRNDFKLTKKIASATLFVTAHGMYEILVNGNRVGDAYLSPGWTSYNTRLQYQVYDVTNLLASGPNAIGAMVGSGWYRGSLAWTENRNIFGNKIGLLAQLNLTYASGETEVITTNEAWKSAESAIKAVEIYNGEVYDARAEKTGWASAGFKTDGWQPVAVAGNDYKNLVATENEPIRKHESFKAAKVITTPAGEKVLDFGQNLVGWVIVKAKGKAGDTVRMKHFEVLDKHGNVYTENLRSAKATATYILKGGTQETFEPHFTFYGFRYIQLVDYPGQVNPDDFTAVALYSDMKPTGNFTSSNAMINQLQHNIQWGQRGNFLDVPTDCPQRDERLGWTGDAQAFSRTATFNFDVQNFFDKWMKDVAADQLPNGSVPFVAPNVLGPRSVGSTGWADVATIVPWNIYLAYADKRILETQYPSMQAWVKYMTDSSKHDLWNTGFHFGDWLFYRPSDDNDGRAAVTDKNLIAQCFYANSVQLLINSAQVLNKTEDVARYTVLLKKVKDAFVREYLTPSGRLVSGTQTAYVLALNFDMLPENLRAQAADRLAENVRSYNNHLTTGFLGTPYLCHVLSRFGYTDLAYKLLLQQDYPSWLYPIKMGATTIWERWDGQRPDSSFQTPDMNSFNHYAYGAIGDWMYRVMTGIDTYDDGPGYKHIRIKPFIGGGFTNASASLQTFYGKLSSGWKVAPDMLMLDVEIPPNTTADVYVPASSITSVTEGGKILANNNDTKVRTEDGYVVATVGSGVYHFAVAK